MNLVFGAVIYLKMKLMDMLQCMKVRLLFGSCLPLLFTLGACARVIVLGLCICLCVRLSVCLLPCNNTRPNRFTASKSCFKISDLCKSTTLSRKGDKIGMGL